MRIKCVKNQRYIVYQSRKKGLKKTRRKKVFDKENKEKKNNKIKASKKHYIFNFCYPIEYLFT